MMLYEPETASTGIDELDQALDGLFWGDNVVWEVDDPGASEPFYRAIGQLGRRYRYSGYVSFVREPREVARAYPGFAVIDARQGGALADPGPLLNEIHTLCLRHERDLLLFDPLDAVAERWGAEGALGFFTRCCPMLLELGAIAYWSLGPGTTAQTRREIEAVTQCVIAVGEDRIRITKAEGRPFSVQGAVFRYEPRNGQVALEPAPAAARLGMALRALRVQRNLSQSELARMAGVSASAVSQAERGHRGLSLETLLDLTGRLGITLDELLHGEVAPGYRLARRHDPHTVADGQPLPLLDNPEAGLRAYLVRLPPRGEWQQNGVTKSLELVAVASGLVQVVMPAGRTVLREGEVLLVYSDGITSCRNLSGRESMLFWILRDERVVRRGSTAD